MVFFPFLISEVDSISRSFNTGNNVFGWRSAASISFHFAFHTLSKCHSDCTCKCRPSSSRIFSKWLTQLRFWNMACELSDNQTPHEMREKNKNKKWGDVDVHDWQAVCHGCWKMEWKLQPSSLCWTDSCVEVEWKNDLVVDSFFLRVNLRLRFLFLRVWDGRLMCCRGNNFFCFDLFKTNPQAHFISVQPLTFDLGNDHPSCSQDVHRVEGLVFADDSLKYSE